MLKQKAKGSRLFSKEGKSHRSQFACQRDTRQFWPRAAFYQLLIIGSALLIAAINRELEFFRTVLNYAVTNGKLVQTPFNAGKG
jgi:hypothetical protein